MCGGGPSLPPAVDPKAQREQAAAEATASTNAKTSAMRMARRNQSLLASGYQGATGPVTTSTVLAQGKDKLGS